MFNNIFSTILAKFTGLCRQLSRYKLASADWKMDSINNRLTFVTSSCSIFPKMDRRKVDNCLPIIHEFIFKYWAGCYTGNKVTFGTRYILVMLIAWDQTKTGQIIYIQYHELWHTGLQVEFTQRREIPLDLLR